MPPLKKMPIFINLRPIYHQKIHISINFYCKVERAICSQSAMSLISLSTQQQYFDETMSNPSTNQIDLVERHLPELIQAMSLSPAQAAELSRATGTILTFSRKSISIMPVCQTCRVYGNHPRCRQCDLLQMQTAQRITKQQLIQDMVEKVRQQAQSDYAWVVSAIERSQRNTKEVLEELKTSSNTLNATTIGLSGKIDKLITTSQNTNQILNNTTGQLADARTQISSLSGKMGGLLHNSGKANEFLEKMTVFMEKISGFIQKMVNKKARKGIKVLSGNISRL